MGGQTGLQKTQMHVEEWNGNYCIARLEEELF